MPNAQLINRSDIPKEPEYNCSDEKLSAAQVCPQAEENENDKPQPKIIQTFYADIVNERPIKKISNQKEIYLIVETENMNGKDVIIDIPKKRNYIFKFNGEDITPNKVLKLSINNNTEKVKLEVFPSRKKETAPKVDEKKSGSSDSAIQTEKTTKKKEEKKKDKELKRIVFKRKKILWGELVGIEEESGRDQYGHWWVEIDGNESYGWWPIGQVDFKGTIMGVPGALNRDPSNKSTIDPHHNEDADMEFSPVIDAKDTRTTNEIINCIRKFAKAYAKTHPSWSYPAIGKGTGNCQTFQEEMIKHCKIGRKGTVTHKNPKGEVTDTHTPKNIQATYN